MEQTYEKLYLSYYTNYIKQLEEGFEEFKKKNSKKYLRVIRQEYNRPIIFELEHGIKCRKEPYHPKVNAFNTLKNAFKEQVISEFNYSHFVYAVDPIDNFVEDDLEPLRVRHLEWMKDPKQAHNYQWDTDFIKNATKEEILKMIAKYNAYDDYLKGGESFENQQSDEFLKAEEEEENILLTNAQQVIAIMLIDEVYKLKKHTDQKRLEEFLFSFTGKNKRNLSRYMTAYKKGDGILHLSIIRNIKDYLVVRKLFERIENQKIIDLIDAKLKYLNRMNDK